MTNETVKMVEIGWVYFTRSLRDAMSGESLVTILWAS